MDQAVVLADDAAPPHEDAEAEADPAPESAVRLWAEVSETLASKSTVVWQMAVETLVTARAHLLPDPPSPAARRFLDANMTQIVNILLDQRPYQIGPAEKGCVEKSLCAALLVIRDDLARANGADELADKTSDGVGGEGTDRSGDRRVPAAEAPSLPVLEHILNKRRTYYKAASSQWSRGGGMPEVRTHMIMTFRRLGGLRHLVPYLERRAGGPDFPAAPVVIEVLGAVIVVLNRVGGAILTAEGDARVRRTREAQRRLRNPSEAPVDGEPRDAVADPEEQTSKHEAYVYEIEGIVRAVSRHLLSLDESILKKVKLDLLQQVVNHLKTLHSQANRLGSAGRLSTALFYDFWRDFSLKLVKTASLPLKLFGWDNVTRIIEGSREMAPPPKSYVVSGAGTPFVNGTYELDPKRIDEEGNARDGELQYLRRVPGGGAEKGAAAGGVPAAAAAAVPADDGAAAGPQPANAAAPDASGAGKTITLFRCTMRSQQKWWFLSEADPVQPGTDKDVDYYQHKSRRDEEGLPSRTGWLTCRTGADPPPSLEPRGVCCPPGGEEDTAEHRLARWAIENGVVEYVLGDSVHREVVSRSAELIRFLSDMRGRYGASKGGDAGGADTGGGDASRGYCLRASHLSLAWKTCTSKADAAVSTQIHKLLVGVLPGLGSGLAMPLIRTVRESLGPNVDGNGAATSPGHFAEVSEFCRTVAEAGARLWEVDASSSSATSANDDGIDEVRCEVLSLQWSVLTHRDALLMKSYEVIKGYVTAEMRKQDPRTCRLRDEFLGSVRGEIARNVDARGGAPGVGPAAPVPGAEGPGGPAVAAAVDETHALHMVRLCRFLLEGYTHAGSGDGAARLAAACGDIPELLFRDVVSYLRRRGEEGSVQAAGGKRTLTTQGAGPGDFDHTSALATRLETLRFVYGLSPDYATLSSEQCTELWESCASSSSDREALMVFFADASRPEGGLPPAPPAAQGGKQLPQPQPRPPQGKPGRRGLGAAFTSETAAYVFANLLCSEGVDWDGLGERAYSSFRQFGTDDLGKRRGGRTVDALWRICLTAGDDGVAERAMKDLLEQYTTAPPGPPTADAATAPVANDAAAPDDFSRRIFETLSSVRASLESSVPSAVRSAERCVRILSTSIADSDVCGSPDAVARRLAGIESGSPPGAYLDVVPHGLRGRHGAMTVGIVAKLSGRINDEARQGQQQQAQGQTSSSNGSGSDRFNVEIHPLQTLGSVKSLISTRTGHPVGMIRLMNILGRPRGKFYGCAVGALPRQPDSTLAADAGVASGVEIVALLTDRPAGDLTREGKQHRPQSILLDDDKRGVREEGKGANGAEGEAPSSKSAIMDPAFLSGDQFFDTLISILEALPRPAAEADDDKGGDKSKKGRENNDDTRSLVWSLLLSMPTNTGMVRRVECATNPSTEAEGKLWWTLLSSSHTERSVYVLQIVDALLSPSSDETFSSLPESDAARRLSGLMRRRSAEFRGSFVDSGGFDAVLMLFVECSSGSDVGGSDPTSSGRRWRMVYECALSIISHCIFGPENDSISEEGTRIVDVIDQSTLRSFLKGLAVISTSGVGDETVLNVLRLVSHLIPAEEEGDDGGAASALDEKLLTSLLLWKGGDAATNLVTLRSASTIRKRTEELIASKPSLSAASFPWLVASIGGVEPSDECADEFFSVLARQVRGSDVSAAGESDRLRALGDEVCNKVAGYPRATSGDGGGGEDSSTCVLCGCLNMIVALVEMSGSCRDVIEGEQRDAQHLLVGSGRILEALDVTPWWDEVAEASSAAGRATSDSVHDRTLINLMGSIFDGFVMSPSGMPPVCSDARSRTLAFGVVNAAAKMCNGGLGYSILSAKIDRIISSVSPSIRHQWGIEPGSDDTDAVKMNKSARYSGLKNQGCTCYMNSVLQQLFMMPNLKRKLCEAVLPADLRSGGAGSRGGTNGASLVGKKVTLHWENGNKYDAHVAGYNETRNTHIVNYVTMAVATSQDNIQGGGEGGAAFNASLLPPDLPEEFVLSEGRPGKETGVLDVLPPPTTVQESTQPCAVSARVDADKPGPEGPTETEDEASSRKLLEEVQRTFVNLNETKGRCYDPRGLVEASHCLKLEFDVWQQNDASEFAMKLLDRLETSLKKWSPEHCQYVSKTFGMKQTAQKICKECGLKTNREEDHMNIICEIRNKSSIHEAMAGMCEDEVMDGDNKVYCDRCKAKTDTVRRTAISALPNMLVLSLKRFDLDYTTFETVKLNSRCEFPENLNMKKYTLEAKEIMEESRQTADRSETGSMELETSSTMDGENDPLASLPDVDYEYRLAGVLVHAGVAQGGHYYSFIKDRSSAQWYKFDDEDVTPFDSSNIEAECFGGKFKKETKYNNGHVNVVEQEKFANALMLFYEKVKPLELSDGDDDEKDRTVSEDSAVKWTVSNGFDVFLPEVQKSNSIHSWQSLLLADEFQHFVKDILSSCTEPADINSSSLSASESGPGTSPLDPWHRAIIRTSLSFVFDVLFHLNIKSALLSGWEETLVRALASPEISATFIEDLAERTKFVFENWIRAYSMECPEKPIRRAAMKVFASTIVSLLSNASEQSCLESWARAWSKQVSELRLDVSVWDQNTTAMPCKLIVQNADCHPLEDPTQIGRGSSSTGILLSFMAELMEVSPRYLQSNCDIGFLIRELASCELTTVGKLLRDALVSAQFVLRLYCLGFREKCQEPLRTIFPGSTISPQIAEAISRSETYSTNMMQISAYNVNDETAFILTEAIGCLLTMPWVRREDLCFVSEHNRGRGVKVLTPKAVEALRIVFNDSKPPSSNGMTKGDALEFLKTTGQGALSQRIDHLFEKYAVSDGTKQDHAVLTVDGFLAHYKDLIQSNEEQVRTELSLFGFRPNLSRRERTRSSLGNEPRLMSTREGIALDVFSNRNLLPCVTDLTIQTIHMLNFYHHLSLNHGKDLAGYVMAAIGIGRDNRAVILETLKVVNEKMSEWTLNSQPVSLVIQVFGTFCALPDREYQQDAIACVMSNRDENERNEHGLAIVGNHFRQNSNTFQNEDILRKYIHIVKRLSQQSAIDSWLKNHSNCTEWLKPNSVHQHEQRRGGAGHQDRMDSMFEDSEDNDSRFSDDSVAGGIQVEGCGLSEINGYFRRVGFHDDCPKFCKMTTFRGREEVFSLFRCRLTDNTRRWYISIVPMNSQPGTTKDVDFYAALALSHDDYPPAKSWMSVPHGGGIDPPPTLTTVFRDDLGDVSGPIGENGML